MPSYGMVRIHRQARTLALATREGRDADLFAYYKQALSEGFRPLLLRQKQQGLGEETLEHRLAQSLPRQAFRWSLHRRVGRAPPQGWLTFRGCCPAGPTAGFQSNGKRPTWTK